MNDLLQLKHVKKSFGGLLAVDDLTFSVGQGEVLGLIGPNGAGKTTVFNLIAGVYAPDLGRIVFRQNDITGLPPHHTCREGIGRTFQIAKPFLNLTVWENILIGSFPKSRNKREAREKTETILSFVGLQKKKDRLAKQLTLADRKLLEVGKALATEPSLILLDEVIAGLNEKETEEAIGLIQQIRERHISILIIEHIFKVILDIADRAIVLDHGQKIAEGRPEAVMNQEKVIQAYFGESYASA